MATRDVPSNGGPRASVIICVHNRALQIAACLDSLLALDFENFEIIAVDDASTDSTVEVLENYRERSDSSTPVRVVRNSRNLGVSGARNAGIEAARGEVIAFTDSDCTVDRQWLTKLAAPFSDPRIGAVSGQVEDAPARSYAERAYRGTCRIHPAGVQARNLVGCNMAFRGGVLRRHLFDPALRYGCDEDDVAWRIRREGLGIAHVPDALVLHDHHLDARGYLRMAYRQGQGSAQFWRKQGRLLGRDLIFLALAMLSSPLVLVGGAWWLIPAVLLALQIAALLFNEVRFKRKPAPTAVAVLPLNLAHSMVKLYSVVTTRVRIALGLQPPT